MKNRILLAAIAIILTGSFITSCSKEKIHDLVRRSDDKSGRSSGQSSSGSGSYDAHSSSGSGSCGDHGSNSGSGSNN